MGAFNDADGYTTRAQRAEMERALRQVAAVREVVNLLEGMERVPRRPEESAEEAGTRRQSLGVAAALISSALETE